MIRPGSPGGLGNAGPTRPDYGVPPAGQWAAFAGSTLATGNAADAQALFRASGQYLTDLLGGSNGGGNGTWAYSGLTLDTTRRKVLSVCNGGDPDGADNGHYEFDLATHSWGSGPVLNPTYLSAGDRLIPLRPGEPALDIYTDTLGHFGPAGGTFPCSRHSYYGCCFLPTVGPNGTVWLAGGSRWWDGSSVNEVWYVDPVTHAATKQATNITTNGLGLMAVTDPDVPTTIWAHGHNFLFTYDTTKPDDPTRITQISGDEGDWTAAEQGCLFDIPRRRFVTYGNRSGPSFGQGLGYYDLIGSPGTRQGFLPTGDWPTLTNYAAVGGCYDIVRDRYILWLGDAGATQRLYEVHPDTLVTTLLTLGGDAPPTGVNTGGARPGTWSRFLYDAPQDRYLLFNQPRDLVYAARHP